MSNLSPTSKYRLIRLAARLYEIAQAPRPDRVFDLSVWVGTARDRYGISCGTRACAVGEACCAIPEFQAQGLRLSTNVQPEYLDVYHWSAVEAFFEIEESVAGYLFAEDHYEEKDQTSPAEVADRIVALVHTGHV